MYAIVFFLFAKCAKYAQNLSHKVLNKISIFLMHIFAYFSNFWFLRHIFTKLRLYLFMIFGSYFGKVIIIFSTNYEKNSNHVSYF